MARPMRLRVTDQGDVGCRRGKKVATAAFRAIRKNEAWILVVVMTMALVAGPAEGRVDRVIEYNARPFLASDVHEDGTHASFEVGIGTPGTLVIAQPGAANSVMRTFSSALQCTMGLAPFMVARGVSATSKGFAIGGGVLQGFPAATQCNSYVYEPFAAHVALDGTLDWIQRFVAPTFEYSTSAQRVAVDRGSGDIVLFASGIFPSNASGYLAARFSSLGQLQWLREYRIQNGYSLGSGITAVAERFNDQGVFYFLGNLHSSGGSEVPFLLSLAPNGQVLFARIYANTGRSSTSTAISISPNGLPVIVVSTSNTSGWDVSVVAVLASDGTIESQASFKGVPYGITVANGPEIFLHGSYPYEGVLALSPAFEVLSKSQISSSISSRVTLRPRSDNLVQFYGESCCPAKGFSEAVDASNFLSGECPLLTQPSLLSPLQLDTMLTSSPFAVVASAGNWALAPTTGITSSTVSGSFDVPCKFEVPVFADGFETSAVTATSAGTTLRCGGFGG